VSNFGAKDKLTVFVGTAESDEPRIKWPWGTRAVISTGGVEALAADAPVEYWVCCRVDEPWTWKVMTDQHVGACVRCDGAVIYRVSAKSPTDPAVKKLCKRCAERMVTKGDNGRADHHG
jgi:hypothetical protein